MNRYKLKANKRYWFCSTCYLSLPLAVKRCKDVDPGSYSDAEDIIRIKNNNTLYDGISVYRVKTFQSKLLRVMYE